MIETLENSLAFDRLAPATGPRPLSSGPQPALNVCVLYEDAPTRDWARDVCGRVAKLVGGECLRITWWSLADLNEPAVLAGAVSTALRADVVVVAVRAAERFPLPFYVWADAWVPYHTKGAAALVALMALPQRPIPQMDRARDYLRAMAKQGRLDFLIEERLLPDPAPMDPASAPIPLSSRLPLPRPGRTRRPRGGHLVAA